MTVSFYFFIVQKYGENNNKKRENSYKGRGVSLFIEYCDRLLLKPPLQSGVLGDADDVRPQQYATFRFHAMP